MTLAPQAVHGVNIRLAGDASRRSSGGLEWRLARVAELPPDPDGAPLTDVDRGGRRCTPLSFVDDRTGEIVCRWLVADDGSVVHCEAAAWVGVDDLRWLLEEPVMRVVLDRRGLASLHAAAVVKDGRAILLMGEKGAGKSSLAGALCARGWRPMADDLARVSEVDGVWRVFRGVPRVSVNADAAMALGYRPKDLATRWSVPIEAAGNKYVLPLTAAEAETAPVAAMLFAGPRASDGRRLEARSMGAGEQVAWLVANLTPSAPPLTKPTPAAWAAVQGLLGQCGSLKLTLPDSLEQLGAAAAELELHLARVLSNRIAAANA
jgi:hypothetical protein